MNDNEFLDHVADRLAALPTVRAVSLGGSRAQGTHRPGSDWDLAIYYRGEFYPDTLRVVGWPGEVSEVGGWGGGVFNGGAWLEIDGRRVDVHYRDLDSVEHELAEAAVGRLRIEPLLFHLAGIPSYLVVAELGINRVLRGELPRPIYPAALREAAPKVWWGNAELLFTYARANHAPHGRLTQCVGLIAQGASQAAHAVLAARGEWVTNEKTLLTRADLYPIDRMITEARPDPEWLRHTVDQAHTLCVTTVRAATVEDFVPNAPWNVRFLSLLCAHLSDLQERGALVVERIELVDNKVITVLWVPSGAGRRFGQVVDLGWLRSQFEPDRPSGVADAWFLTIYPPHEWNEQHVVDGICWHAGKTG